MTDTSSNSIIRKLIENADVQLKQEIENLVAGGTIESPVHEDITYEDIEKSKENLWNFMYFTGYLKKVSQRQEEEQLYMLMKIPNVEVNYLYKSKIMEWMQEKLESENLHPLYDALLQGNQSYFQTELTRYLQESISFYDSKESFYHGFLLGLLKQMRDYIVESNREAGDGRLDILIRSLNVKKPVVIMELKVSEDFQGMKNKSEAALCQIDRKHYARELQLEGYENVIWYGIAFYGKNCRVTKW